jgi:hypothetical protein
LIAKSLQCLPKQLLEQGRRPMLIGVGQTGFAGRFRYSQMFQFTQATLQAVANEPQRIGVRQVAKQHRNKLSPTGESSRMPFRFGFFHQSAKFCAGKMLKKLIKQTGGLYHVRALPFCGLFRIRPVKDQMRFSTIPEGIFFCRSILKT